MEEINNSGEQLWGPVDPDNWEKVQFIKDEVATESDVKAGRAVFVMDSKGLHHQALNIKIPSLAYHVDQETGEKTLVIVIQAEKAGEDEEVVGLRYFEGGVGACLLFELEFV